MLIGVEQKIIKLNRHGIQDEFTYDKNKRLIKLKRLKNNEIWVSGINSKIYKINLKDAKIRFTDSIPISFVSDITTTVNGTYWFTSTDKGIYSSPDINIKKLTIPNKIESNKTTFLQSNRDKLYVPYKGENMAIIDKYLNINYKNGYRESVNITGLTFDQNGKIITNHDYLFSRLDTLTPYPKYNFVKVLHVSSDTFIAGGIGGFGLFKNALMIYGSRDDGFTERVTDIALIDKNVFIIATTSGLYQFDANRKKNDPFR